MVLRLTAKVPGASSFRSMFTTLCMVAILLFGCHLPVLVHSEPGDIIYQALITEQVRERSRKLIDFFKNDFLNKPFSNPHIIESVSGAGAGCVALEEKPPVKDQDPGTPPKYHLIGVSLINEKEEDDPRPAGRAGKKKWREISVIGVLPNYRHDEASGKKGIGAQLMYHTMLDIYKREETKVAGLCL